MCKTRSRERKERNEAERKREEVGVEVREESEGGAKEKKPKIEQFLFHNSLPFFLFSLGHQVRLFHASLLLVVSLLDEQLFD